MTVPAWLFAVVVVWALVATFREQIASRLPILLPFPDRGFRIFVCKDARAMNVVADLLGREGLNPRFRMNSGNVRRVIMSDGFTILNAPSEELRGGMKNPAASLAVPVEYPETSARQAVLWLLSWGFSSSMEALPEVPGKPKAMYYVTSEAFPGWVLLFRLPMIKMGKPPIEKYR